MGVVEPAQECEREHCLITHAVFHLPPLRAMVLAELFQALVYRLHVALGNVIVDALTERSVESQLRLVDAITGLRSRWGQLARSVPCALGSGR